MGSAEAKPAGHIYCATGAPVGKEGTADLLHGGYDAIWCPPPGRIPWHSDPRPGDKLWLVWREEKSGQPVYLLGCGFVREAPQGRYQKGVLWTDTDCRGIREAARKLGYGGGPAVAFLRLGSVRKPANGFPVVKGLIPTHNGLTEATAVQARLLDRLCADTQTEELSLEATLGAAKKAAWTLAEGEELGGYRIIRAIGRGGMGEVYLVENVEMGKRYAMKLLPEELTADRAFRQRFRREARVMADLDHPGIVRVNHMAEEAGRFFLVMDYVEGPEGSPCTLEAELKEREYLSEEETRDIALDLCEALAAAHGRGVVHRDIKPANVLLDRDSRTRLSDFGLAHVVGDEYMKSLTQRSVSLSVARTGGGGLSESENAVVGTYEYMSPEQKAGGPADERSDIYSLGLVIYRTLTGRKAEGVFRMPSDFRCSPGWDTILDNALASEPEDRYDSVHELLDDLEDLDSEARSVPASPDRRIAKAVGIAIWVGVALLVLLLLFMIFASTEG